MSRNALTSAALALLLATSFASVLSASTTQLSAGHPYSDIDTNLTQPRFSPNGLYAVYVEDAVTDFAGELWSVAVAGGAPVRLSDVLPPGQRVSGFAISPDSTRVVYITDQDTLGKVELFSVPIGGGVSVRLNGNLITGGNVINFHISPGGDRVYFVADKSTNQKYELFGVPIAGGSAVRLDTGANSNFDVDTYAISPDGATVVYRMVVTVLGDAELWSVPADGPADASVKISPFLGPNGAVDPYFRISPNGARVVFSADVTVDDKFDLFSVPIGGGTPDALTSGIASGMSVDPGFLISADSSKVVFRAAVPALPVYQLFSAPLSGGTAALVSGLLTAGGNVGAPFLLTPSGGRVVYRADSQVNDVDELWSAPVGGGTPVKLNGPLAGGGDVIEFAISPNGTRVVYRADETTDTLNELWSVPTNGGAAVRLNRDLVAGGDVQNFLISPNSAWVVYGADQDVDTADELLRAPIGGGIVEAVSDPLASGGDVLLKLIQAPLFEISPTNSYDVLYAADQETNDQFELFLSGVPEEDPDACTPDATTLCLQDDKFNVSVTWRDFQGRTGQGQATALSGESGDFWFFNSQSNELIVKVINGCASTGKYWVFWRALSNVEMDLTIRHTGTDQVLSYHNPLGFNPNGHLDIDTIFTCDELATNSEHFDTSVNLPPPGVPQLIESVDPTQIGPCVPNSDRSICLQGGRFRVEGTWSDFSGGSGFAHMIKKNEGSGYAWFFNSNNYEMLFKMVNACSYNGNTWVSIAGLTNVAVSLKITDTWTGTIYMQNNLLGVDFPTNLDIETNLTYCGTHP